MNPQPYGDLADSALLALAIFREARGEPYDGKRAVGHVIRNRTLKPGWWGKDWKSVVLKPWQFSSFNQNDPNSKVWPADEDASWAECVAAATVVYGGVDEDLTGGAVYYFDVSIPWPIAWGSELDFINTLNLGRLKFYKPIPKR